MAVTLFASSYAGTVDTLCLNMAGGNATLQHVASDKSCGAMPSWLTVDPARKALYCSNEAASPNGTLTSYTFDGQGALTLTGNATTMGGDVFSELYGGADKNQFIALAEFGTSSISTFELPAKDDSKAKQTFTFTMDKPGPVPDRQTKPNPHQTVLDPTGAFLLAPDLGADLIRIFAVDASTGELTEQESFTAEPGSGPRHVAFFTPAGADPKDGKSVMYLASELANSVSSFTLSYPDAGKISIAKLQDPVKPYPNGTAPANVESFVGEVRVVGNTLTASNRGDGSFGTGKDSLAVFDLAADGKFTFRNLADAGGNFPRTMVINKAGDMVATGLQKGNSVAVLQRDPKTGDIGKVLATLQLGGQVSSVIWNE